MLKLAIFLTVPKIEYFMIFRSGLKMSLSLIKVDLLFTKALYYTPTTTNLWYHTYTTHYTTKANDRAVLCNMSYTHVLHNQ